MGRLKRSELPVFVSMSRKNFKFAPWPRGPKESYTLTVVVRDILRLARNLKEVKKILNSGVVSVDGKARKDTNFACGLMNVISVGSSSYRIVPTRKGLRLAEISDSESKLKLCKVIGKKILRGGKIQINLHDGSNILVDRQYSTKNVLLLKIPERKIEKEIKFQEGAVATIIKGKNTGVIGKISRIEKIRGMQPNKVYLQVGESTLEFPEDYVFVLGEDKPVIKIGD